MVDRIDDPGQRVDALETRLDHLSASVDRRFDTVDRRFDAVDAGFLEQRQYTEFAFEKLERTVNARFDQVDARFAGVDTRLAGVEVEVRVVSSGLGRVERKLDQLIDRMFPEPPA